MDGAVYIERKIEDWDYHAKTTRRVAKNACLGKSHQTNGNVAPGGPQQNICYQAIEHLKQLKYIYIYIY